MDFEVEPAFSISGGPFALIVAPDECTGARANGETGFYVPIKDIPELIGALAIVKLEHDRDQRA